MRNKLIFAFSFLILFGCKKDPQIISSSPVAEHKNAMIAKVNGQYWSMAPKRVEIIRNVQNIQFDGHTDTQSAIHINFVLPAEQVAPYNLTGQFQGVYIDDNGVVYVGRYGNLNITSIDTLGTSANELNRLQATFNFTTFTVNGKTSVIQDGVIDYQKK